MTQQIGDIVAKTKSTADGADSQPSDFTKNYGQFERNGSTFKHEITTHAGTKLTGYSKPRNQPEPADKQVLLTKVIGRLHRNYLVKGGKIVFYRIYDANPANDEEIVTLYKERYEAVSRVAVGEKWLMDWLQTFYNQTTSYNNNDRDLIPKSQPVRPTESAPPAADYDPTGLSRRESRHPPRPTLIPDSARQPAYQDPLDKNRQFANQDELHVYIQKLRQGGVPNDAIRGFYDHVRSFIPK